MLMASRMSYRSYTRRSSRLAGPIVCIRTSLAEPQMRDGSDGHALARRVPPEEPRFPRGTTADRWSVWGTLVPASGHQPLCAPAPGALPAAAMIEADFTTLVGPALARALENRGFTTLMPVQAAVLAPELAGRDLRISSQTG